MLGIISAGVAVRGGSGRGGGVGLGRGRVSLVGFGACVCGWLSFAGWETWIWVEVERGGEDVGLEVFVWGGGWMSCAR